jgi:hypothetical protein
MAVDCRPISIRSPSTGDRSLALPQNVVLPASVRRPDGANRLTEHEPAPTEGSKVGRYSFLRELAQGPFGPLYEARSDTDDGALPALARVILLPRGLAAAEEESIAQAAWDSTEIGHDGVLRVADAVFGTGWFALIHDHSEGTLLSTLRLRADERRMTFPAGVAVRIALDILQSLGQGQEVCESTGLEWSAGSVAATSLYLCGDGKTRSLDGQVVAAALKWESLRAVTGALAYAAPEMLDPRLLSDERSDIFAVGVVLWEMLTGKRLLAGDSTEVAQRLLKELPSAAIAMPAGVRMPRGMPQVLRTALSLDPDKRFATRGELASALSKAVDVVAGYGKVIEFTDLLLRRESTLFRLDQPPAPQLSQKLQSILPKAPHDARVRPRPPRARTEVAGQATIQSRPMIVVSPPPPAPRVEIADAAQPTAEPAPATQAPDVKSSLAQLRRTLVGVAGTNASLSHNPTLLGVPPIAPAPRDSKPDTGSARIMTLLGMDQKGARAAEVPPSGPAEEPSTPVEPELLPAAPQPSEPPTAVIGAAKLAEIKQAATQDLSISLAESLSGKPVAATPTTQEPVQPAAQAQRDKRTIQVSVTTLVLGFAATVLSAAVITLLAERALSPSAAPAARAADEPAAPTRASAPPSRAVPSSPAPRATPSQPSAATLPIPAEAPAAETRAPDQQEATSPPTAAASEDSSAAKATAPARPQPAVRRKRKKRYVPSDL